MTQGIDDHAGKRKHSAIIIAVVVAVVVFVVLLYLNCSCFLRRRQRKNHEITILKENCNDGDD